MTKLNLRKKVLQSVEKADIEAAYSNIEDAKEDSNELLQQIERLESYLPSIKAPESDEDENKEKIAQCLHGLIIGYEKLRNATDDSASKTEYNTRRLDFVSKFIIFDVEGELRDGLRDTLIEDWEEDHANLTLEIQNNDTMIQIRILERVLGLTSRDNKNFFAALVVELAKAYKAQSEKVLADLQVLEDTGSKDDNHRL